MSNEHRVSTTVLDHGHYTLECVCGWKRENIVTTSPGDVVLIHLFLASGQYDKVPETFMCADCPIGDQHWPVADKYQCIDESHTHGLCAQCRAYYDEEEVAVADNT